MGCKLCRTEPSDDAVEIPTLAAAGAGQPHEVAQDMIEDTSHESTAPVSTAVVEYRKQLTVTRPSWNEQLHVSNISWNEHEETTYHPEPDERTPSVETTNWDPESSTLSEESLTDARHHSMEQWSPSIMGKKHIRSQTIVSGTLNTHRSTALSPVENDFGQSYVTCSEVSSLSADLQHHGRHGSTSTNRRPYVLTGHDNTESSDFTDTIVQPYAVGSSSSTLAHPANSRSTSARVSAMKLNLETGLKSASSRLSKSDSQRNARISDSSSESGDA